MMEIAVYENGMQSFRCCAQSSGFRKILPIWVLANDFTSISLITITGICWFYLEQSLGGVCLFAFDVWFCTEKLGRGLRCLLLCYSFLKLMFPFFLRDHG